jgi:hypothetical protein
MKNPSIWRRTVAWGRKGRHDDANSRFSKFENASKKAVSHFREKYKLIGILKSLKLNYGILGYDNLYNGKCLEMF